VKLCSCLIVYVLSSELHDGPLTVKVRPTCQMKVHKPNLTLTVLVADNRLQGRVLTQ